MKSRLDLTDRKVIQDLLDHGMEIKEIAEILHRSKSCISAEIKKNGGKRLYNAETAQKQSDYVRIEQNKDKNSPIQHLRRRVDELEKTVSKLAMRLETRAEFPEVENDSG